MHDNETLDNVGPTAPYHYNLFHMMEKLRFGVTASWPVPVCVRGQAGEGRVNVFHCCMVK